MNRRLTGLLIACYAGTAVMAQHTCYALLTGDTLKMGNQLVERRFAWNGGNLQTIALTDKAAGRHYATTSRTADFVFVKETAATDATLRVDTTAGHGISAPSLQVTVAYRLGALQVKRVYRLYDGCPAIACDTYLRGSVTSGTLAQAAADNAADRKNIEFSEDMAVQVKTPVLEQLALDGHHWRVRTVEFWDVTDWNNNLVQTKDFVSYRRSSHRGNLLMAVDGRDGRGLFFLKEAPCSSTQLNYGGADFVTDFGHLMVTGVGLTAKDLSEDHWTRAYGCVTGVYQQTELAGLTALRSYQKQLRLYKTSRDEMLMVNTWGDRSQDSRVNENFSLKELECLHRLGMTHFQIDDGWQVGKSPNSAVAKGSFKNIWDNPDYWTPDPAKFPHGLTRVVERARKLGVTLGLWFNPSVQDDFADWQRDADALIKLYRQYGITVFKIDGLTISSKRGEERLRQLFDRVLQETGYRVVFNLDATASRRGGYHMLSEYGNVFLENRYTDWGNYYPYQTLRNVWQLARYVPAERLQVEFLNKWRNADKYGDDPYAPGNYSLDYLFAIAMAGQPLAWMETTALPHEAYGLKRVIHDYRRVATDFHRGTILPIGQEPSGQSWTGFQSLTDSRKGYLLVFREDNEAAEAWVQTWLPPQTTVRLRPVVGQGRAGTLTTDGDGRLHLQLADKNSYIMYEYQIENQ